VKTSKSSDAVEQAAIFRIKSPAEGGGLASILAEVRNRSRGRFKNPFLNSGQESLAERLRMLPNEPSRQTVTEQARVGRRRLIKNNAATLRYARMVAGAKTTVSSLICVLK
jgi:hypothetical protein